MENSSTPAFFFDRVDRRTKKVTRTLIDAIVERIIISLHPLQVILFGSRAQGNATIGSDIDLLIRVDDHHQLSKLRLSERSGKVLDLFRYRSFGLDVIFMTQSEIEMLQSTNEGEWDLVLEILEHGKTLYERSEISKTK